MSKEVEKHIIDKNGYCRECGVLQDGATTHTLLNGETFIMSEHE